MSYDKELMTFWGQTGVKTLNSRKSSVFNLKVSIESGRRKGVTKTFTELSICDRFENEKQILTEERSRIMKMQLLFLSDGLYILHNYEFI